MKLGVTSYASKQHYSMLGTALETSRVIIRLYAGPSQKSRDIATQGVQALSRGTTAFRPIILFSDHLTT